MLPDVRIVVPPFVEQEDGADFIIANTAKAAFLSVPREAVALLLLLADGRSVGEASAIYSRIYGVAPDVDDFLGSLTEAGFLDDQHTDPTVAPDVELANSRRRYHFANIPQVWAQRIFSVPVVGACLGLIALALAAVFLDPTLLPGPDALVFAHDGLILTPLVIVLSLALVFAHEFAHLVAARAAGVPSRIGVGTRLWELVAETDMTGIWLASRRERCLAFLAGMLLDLTVSALIVLSLFSADRGALAIDPTMELVLRALLFVQLTKVLFEFYVFVPTDVYYVIGTLFGCKNLMGDTQAYLSNLLWRLLRRPERVRESAVPAHEMRVVRWFSLAWLGGRGLAFASLFFITLPVLSGYVGMIGRSVVGDNDALRVLTDGPALALLMVALESLGIFIWLRGVFRARRHAHAA